MPDQVIKIRDLFDQGRFAEAQVLMDRYIKANADSPYLPVIYWAQAKTQKTPMAAITKMINLIDRFPESTQAQDARFELAQIFFVTGNSTAASAECKRFLEMHPDHKNAPAALLMLASLNAQAGKTRLAANRFAEVAARYPKSEQVAPALVGIGDCKFRIDDLAGAQRAYEKALETKSQALDYGKIFYQLGVLSNKRERFAEAKRYYMILIQSYPGSKFAALGKANLSALDSNTRSPATGVQTLSPLALPSIAFAVRVGKYDTLDGAQTRAERFLKAGHLVDVRPAPDGFEIIVGRFSSEMDAFFFAEQLEKKFGVRTEIVKLGN